MNLSITLDRSILTHAQIDVAKAAAVEPARSGIGESGQHEEGAPLIKLCGIGKSFPGVRALNRVDPHESGIWAFEDLSAQRPVKAELTAREREVAARLLDGLTSKEIGKTLAISHRTVEIYRARLMRKYRANTTADLVHKLMAGAS